MPFQAKGVRARMDVLRTVMAFFLWFQTTGFSFIVVQQGEFKSQKPTASQRQIQVLQNPGVTAASRQQTVSQCETIDPGPKEVPVPPLERLTVGAASRTLQQAGLNLGRVSPPNGTGVVVQQSLEPNRCVPIGTPVDILIKDVAPAPATTVEVPNLRGKSPFEAVFVLARRGLRPGGSSKEQSNEVAPGRIFNQEPAAGTLVPKGTAVVVTLAEVATASPPAQGKTSAPPETLSLKSNLNGPAIPGELVTLIATAQGPAHTIQYQFDFGDGTKSTPNSSPQARHVYKKDGNYTASVTAILDGGVGQATATTDISVHDAPQGVTLEVSPGPVKEKQSVTFTAHPYPPEPAPLLYTFKFGDKSERVSETPSVTHAYQESNVYRPLVTIETAHRHKASSHTITLIVVKRIPVWAIILIVAGAVASAAFVGVIGHKLLQRWVTRRIRLSLRPGEFTMPLQSLRGDLKEDEFQFHTNHSPGVIVVQERASVVHRVEVRK